MTAPPYHRPTDPAARVGLTECGFCGHCHKAAQTAPKDVDAWLEARRCPRGCPKGQLRLPMRGAA